MVAGLEGQSCVARESQVAERMKRLNGYADELEKTADEVEMRLSGIARSVPPMPGPPPGDAKEPREDLVDHARAISEVCKRVSTATRRIDSVLGRLEI